MGRTMTKNPSWIQFSDDAWGEAVGGNSDHNDWLRSLDAPELPTDALDQLPDHDAPLVPEWIKGQLAEPAQGERARVIGPYEPTWAYLSSIEAEVGRLAAACRASTGMERESNMRQLREAESALREYCQTPEYRNAVAYSLSVVDTAIKSAGSVLTPEQIAAKGRYAAIRASLEAMMAEPSGVQSQSSPVGRPIAACADDTPQPAGDKGREPMLRKGANKRDAVAAWVKWHAKAIAEGETEAAKDKIADDILARAERFGYESNTRPLSKESVMRMIPSGLTGGRGRKPGSQSKK